LSIASVVFAGAAEAALSDYVNTLRGTSHVDGNGAVASEGAYSRGNTVPAATRPFGFNFWTPVTNANYSGWPYVYTDTAIMGFACSHQPSVWAGDLAHFKVMPEIGGAVVTDEASRAQPFSHANEIAQAHYYSVQFQNGIKTEIAPTDHASAWQFTYPASNPTAYLLWDTGDPDVTVDTTNRTVSGSFNKTNGSQCLASPCNKLYFYATFSKTGATSGKPAGGGAYIQFTTTANEVVTMNMATSFISVAQAQSNLAQEIGSKTFAAVKAEAAAEWDAILGKVTLTGATNDQLTTFYSSMYRAFVYPNSRWENVVGMGPRYFSPYNSTVMSGKMYVNNGLWDTYRATRPLTVLLAPAKTAEILDGFVNAYKEGGWAPRWSGAGYRASMIGTHSDIVFADAYIKGITNFDYNLAYESMVKNGTVYSADAYKGRQCLERSIFLQYCPADVEAYSASWFLEDTINDHAISLMANALGKTAEHVYFKNRALTYVNLFSTSAQETLPNATVSRGFFRGKKLDGSWRTADSAFRAREWGFEWTEGNAWHYMAITSHDPLGIGTLYGRMPGNVKDARAALSTKIDHIFLADRNYMVGDYPGVIHEMTEGFDLNRGQYVHSNQPVHQMLYMYNYAGTPSKTEEKVRDVLASFFNSGLLPNEGGFGYRGDEDGGEQSSWYIFSVLGFFPTSPGHVEYPIGSPPYTSATINLENGKTFTVSTVGNSAVNKYVQSAKLNGAAYTKNYLTHEQITAGGTLELTMGPAASTWGTAAADTPPSNTTSTVRVPVPMETKQLGGTVTSTSPGAAPTDMAKALDGDGLTKWVAASATPSITYQFPAGNKYTLVEYTLTSADDQPARDPKSWTLQGSNDGAAWSMLDTRTNEAFRWRRQTKVYAVANTTPYAQYRLAISANNGDAASTQLTELDFITDAPVVPASATSDGVSCADPTDDASNAIDGTAATKWCSAAVQASQWLTVDLGTVLQVQQFRVKHAGAGGESATLNTKAFDILLSADNMAWAPAVSVANNTANVTQHTIAPTAARYAKLVPTASEQGAGAHARIYEFEVYAPAKCMPESDPAFCARLSKNCGTLANNDNCGTPRTVSSCGTCTAPNTCGGGGVANVCGFGVADGGVGDVVGPGVDGGGSDDEGGPGSPDGGGGQGGGMVGGPDAAGQSDGSVGGGSAKPGDDGGCGCRAGGAGAPRGVGFAALLGLSLWVGRRRRRLGRDTT
jgi:predicted alpha-1,2-mannosidase